MVKSAFCCLVLSLLCLSGAWACNYVVGGGGSFRPLGEAVLGRCPAGTCSGAKYNSTSSAGSIGDFNAGRACFVVADEPMTSLQEKAAKSVSVVRGKLSLPLVATVYTWFVSYTSGGVIQLDWRQLYNIYSDPSLRQWNRYTKVISGPITVFIRANGAGSNSMARKFWRQASSRTLKLNIGPLDNQNAAFPFPQVNGGYTSGNAIAAAVKAVPGAIGIMQGIIGIRNGLKEVAVKNAAGFYVQGTSSTAQPRQALPRILNERSRTRSFSDCNTVFQIGTQTPVLTAIMFGFLPATKLQTTRNGPLAKRIALYMNQWAPQLSTDHGFFALVGSVYIKNRAAILAAK